MSPTRARPTVKVPLMIALNDALQVIAAHNGVPGVVEDGLAFLHHLAVVPENQVGSVLDSENMHEDNSVVESVSSELPWTC